MLLILNILHLRMFSFLLPGNNVKISNISFINILLDTDLHMSLRKHTSQQRYILWGVEQQAPAQKSEVVLMHLHIISDKRIHH